MKSHRLAYCLLIPLLLLAACASPDSKHPGRHIPPQTPKDQPPHLPDLSEKRRIISAHALESVGVPYRWGGESPDRGFDCSGLVHYSHHQAGISVPRTARDQFTAGKKISSRPFLPGDLVFFRIPKPGKDGLHVGIYVGRGWFVHAPGQGRNVMRSSMDNPYFKKNSVGAATFLD